MRRTLTTIMLFGWLVGCHASDTQPATEMNAGALESNLEQQANAMEAQANAPADRNVADAMTTNATAPANVVAPPR